MSKDSSFDINDKSEITIPLRNLIALLIFVGIATTGYFQLTGRISFLEHNLGMQGVHVDQNSEFRVKWPRGELGSLPDDAEQNMRLTHLEELVKELEEEIEKIKGD